MDKLFQTKLVVGLVTVNLFLLTSVVCNWVSHREKKRCMDDGTLKLLTETPTIPVGIQDIASALDQAGIVESEPECAQQMREIVSSKALEFADVAADPSLLLQVSKFVGKTETHGALWTRFTVQYNLFGGTIIAMGSEDHKKRLIQLQSSGELGCFAFTECGAGVLSGAVVETVAVYNKTRKCFVIHSPNPGSVKKWISQGLYATYAVIMANLYQDEENRGPHLFFSCIQERNEDGSLTPLPGVKLESMPNKTAMRGLDNAFITFQNFEIPHEDMLSKFSSIDKETNLFVTNIPKGNRMVDLFLSRLLTGRIVLSEFTCHHSIKLLRNCWKFATERKLRKGKKKVAPSIADLPLVQNAFVDYSRSLQIISHFIAVSREKVISSIKSNQYPSEVVESACISKFVGTSFSADTASAFRKLMGSQALFEDFWLGKSSFVANATCAAEGDNTIMELKVVQDMIRKRTKLFPISVILRLLWYPVGRKVLTRYFFGIIRALWLGMKAIDEGQLLREIAWCKAHMVIINAWLTENSDVTTERKVEWLESYASVLVRFPIPIQM